MKILLCIMITATLAFGVVPTTSAVKPHEDAVCRKYQKYDKFGNISGNFTGHAWELCREKCKKHFLRCDLMVSILRGKEKGDKYHAFLKDVFHSNSDKQRKGRCVSAMCGARDVFEAAVAWGTPGVKDMLLKEISGDAKLSKQNCGDKKFMYRGLWYLGDKSAADTMIKGYSNLKCTNEHFNFTVPSINHWNLSDAQMDKIAKLCVDQIYGGKLRNAKSSVKACHIFFSKRGKIDEDGLEFIKMAGSDEFALRALAILNPKGSKSKFVKILAGNAQKSPVMKKGKATKKMRTTWRGGRLDAIFSGMALNSISDKAGKGAVAYWLSFEGTKLASRDGFEKVFLMAAPFWPAKERPKLLKVLHKAFATGVKAMAKNDALAGSIRRAAMGLAQMGSNKGLTVLIDALNGDDRSTRTEIAYAIGGTTNLLGGRYTGTGTLLFGKGGLSKADGDKLIAVLAKRAKFEKSGSREPFVRAVLSIRGLMKAAGL